MKKYTSIESKLIVNHVCRCLERNGTSQEKFCSDIELDPSLLSRGKKGKKLSDVYLLKMEEIYGYPNIGKGVYTKSEHYLSLDTFIDEYHKVQERIFTNSQIKILKKPEVIDQILRGLSIENHDVKFQTSKRAYLLSQLNEMINDEAFYDWFDLYEPLKPINTLQNLLKGTEEVHIAVETPSLVDILKSYNMKYIEGFPIEATLQRLGMMNFLLKPIERFDITNPQTCIIPTQKELVISGHLIIEERIVLKECHDLTTRRFKDIVVNNSLKELSLRSINTSRLLEGECSTMNYSEVQLKVFLGEEMGYHFLLDFKGNDSRSVVISIENNSEVVFEISNIHNFFDSEWHNEEYAKKSLALAGAYITGTTLLT
ncbi:MAG: hypothetical protein ACJAXJ_004093 [Colwellia sp.]|jgi:hypothetical protein